MGWRLEEVENDEYELYTPHPDYDSEELLIAEVYWEEYARLIRHLPEMVEVARKIIEADDSYCEDIHLDKAYQKLIEASELAREIIDEVDDEA